MYLLIKHSHVTLAVLSITFFVIRAFWSVRGSHLLNQRWVKVTPHLVDSLLLACAIYLMISIHQYPFTNSWLTAKLLALLLYIGLGTLAIKRGRTATVRLLSAIMAVLVFGYILGVAINRSPSAWW
ncbi:SirB2 family protein [Aestuariirhabdus litorea]|uniref:Regulator SirB n=1 Tax=Aestuariirhabdus litorea TaxID=2528527 RepID=A0A3P3VPV5_9GAMM|nr:SirB2 family protein [Aestuariirhabdus litorea]RRJ84821.1 regulator SirB [Aestuariirhabdus litorea]RWW98046.1 regulator SirB [Endozoicomonadaceae bacterium GTF-13]